MKIIGIVSILFALLVSQVNAETRYITDRILLGIHTEADEKSILIKSVPSGTELEVIGEQDNFIKIRLADGTEGWVNSGYVMSTEPTTRKFDALDNKLKTLQSEYDALKVAHAKKDRELEIRRDELSNAKTTIKEMKKRGGATTTEVTVDPEQEAKLEAALEENKKLQARIDELSNIQNESAAPDQQALIAELKDVKEKYATLKTRIDVALTHLKGERIPTAEELASIRPQWPTWYWTLLVLILIAGVLTGLFIMDYHFRRRHGGFRI